MSQEAQRENTGASDQNQDIITATAKVLHQAREIVESANFFMGTIDGETGFTMQEVQILREESARLKKIQTRTNVGLATGSFLGLYNCATVLIGLAVPVSGAVAATGGVAAVAGGIVTITSTFLSNRREKASKDRIISIDEKFKWYVKSCHMMSSIRYLSPGENAIEKELKRRNMSRRKLIDIHNQARKVLRVLWKMKDKDQDKELEFILKHFDIISGTLKNMYEMTREGSSTSDVETFSRVSATAKWILETYKKTDPKYRHLLYLSSKMVLTGPDIMNGLVKIGVLSERCFNVLGSINVSQSAGKAGKAIGKEVCEEAAEQAASAAGKAGEKGATTSSALLSAKQVTCVKVGVAGIAIASLIIDGITFINSVENLFGGSQTGLPNFLDSLADFIYLLVADQSE